MINFDNTNNTKRNLTIAGFMLAAILIRLLPHPFPIPWNVSPITALALFGGAMLSGRFSSMFIPVAAMLLSDIGLQFLYGTGFHSLMFAVYGCFVIIAIAGFELRRFKNKTAPSLAFAAGGSIFFFLISNFAVWIIGYPHSIAGIIECYVAALPFFQNSFIGDLLFTGAFFGLFSLAERKYPSIAVNIA